MSDDPKSKAGQIGRDVIPKYESRELSKSGTGNRLLQRMSMDVLSSINAGSLATSEKRICFGDHELCVEDYRQVQIWLRGFQESGYELTEDEFAQMFYIIDDPEIYEGTHKEFRGLNLFSVSMLGRGDRAEFAAELIDGYINAVFFRGFRELDHIDCNRRSNTRPQ
jgi:hypothetical protein